jgi:hypothetical protein
MSFKHVKFEDSPVMRSLEKLAFDKGLVKKEEIAKTASKKLDLTPTDNLMENVIHLCAGLREINMHKMADDLEKNLMIYKQAQTLYETSKETGEDLVDAAHPKGGHKLEDVDSDMAKFHTIVEKHLSALKMIEKMPTGKLANAKDIIKAVKVVLAEDTVESLEAQVKDNINKAFNRFNRVREIANKDLTIELGTGAFSEDLFSNPTLDEIQSTKSAVARKMWGLKPGILMGVTEDTWSIISPMIPQVTGFLDKAMEAKRKANQIRAGVLVAEGPGGSGDLTGGEAKKTEDKLLAPTPPHVFQAPDGRSLFSPLRANFSKIKGLKGQLNNWKAIGSIAKSKEATSWINEELATLNEIEQRYTATEKNATTETEWKNLSELNGPMATEISKEETDINQFKADWVPATPATPSA